MDNNFNQTVSNVTDSFLRQTAQFMVALSDTAIGRSAPPWWHHEPEMPKSMLDELMEG